MDIFKIVGKIALDGQDEFNKGVNNAKKAGESLATAVGKSLVTIGKVGVAAMTVATTAVVALSKAGLDAYSNYEQLAGGMDKIFSAMDTSKIALDAAEAYKYLGMSASDYLAVINDVGASFSATMGAEAGYEVAKKGLTAISDYASGTGKSFDELQGKFAMITRSTSSYQSIADQFSGILPATADGFLEQAQACGFLATKYKKLTDVPIDEYQKAVADMLYIGVDALNLTGNTAAEASETISGSIAMAKAAWQNLLVGFADSDQDLDKLVRNFVNSVTTATKNIVPRLVKILGGITAALPEVMALIADELPALLSELLPGIISGAGALIQGLVEALPELLTVLWDALGQIAQGIWDYIVVGFLGIDYDFETALADLTATAKAAWDEIKYVWDTIGQPIWDIIQGCVETTKEVFEDKFPEMSEAAFQCFKDIDTYWNDTLKPCLEAIGNFIEETLAPAFDSVFGTIIPPVIETCFLAGKRAWEEVLMPALTGITEFLTGTFTNDWNLAFGGLLKVVEAFCDASTLKFELWVHFLSSILEPQIETFKEKWAELGQDFSGLTEKMKGKWAEFTDSIDEKLAPIVATVTTRFNEIDLVIAIKSSATFRKVKEIYESIKQEINDRLTEAKDIVKKIVDEIKGFFDFEFKWPHIPMPHFSISPAGWKAADLLEGKIPTLGIEWYAKGGILNSPTIFGMNGNSLMVGGEAGKEAVAPIDTLQGYVAAAVVSQNMMLVEALDRIHNAIMDMDENMGGHLKDALNDTSLKVNNREFGRLVRGVT